jgi:hypothetical protein
MERAVFLIEDSGTRLPCMLNPESLVMRRVAGITRRQTATGPLSLLGQSDDPLLYTGGGSTELLLDLLFDVTLAGASVATSDVRDLTRPLWQLAENQIADDGYARPPIVRFVWGKAWNVPGLVAAVAERLEYFTEGGAPRRSWLRMRLLRVSEGARDEGRPRRAPRLTVAAPTAVSTPREEERAVQVVGGGAPALRRGRGPATGTSSLRLDEIAYRYFGDPGLWRLIAAANGIIDPLRIQAGRILRIPMPTVGGGQP